MDHHVTGLDFDEIYVGDKAVAFMKKRGLSMNDKRVLSVSTDSIVVEDRISTGGEKSPLVVNLYDSDDGTMLLREFGHQLAHRPLLIVER